MFKTSLTFSLVTAVLPSNRTREVIPALLGKAGTDALTWRARGTLLQEHWWKRWLPPIMPTKNILQMLAPADEVDQLIATIVEHGRLHQQATGAVFSTPCDHAYFGSEFDTWPVRDAAEGSAQTTHKLTENLSAIYCIVGPNYTDRVSKAAINAGAHGPIVYYSEGRGLRDRLGWLRITKEHEKTVLMIIADETDADDIFDAMALAGELHLPGRGFMYRLNIDKGMFNLPSRVSHHHYDANMQQIIHAIDHLSGHTHWRDQSVFNVGGGGRGVGLDTLKAGSVQLADQVSLSAIATREHCAAIMDLLLDAGAPGLNITYGRYTGREAAEHIAGAQLNEEYGLLRCITDSITAQKICATVDSEAESRGLRDFCMFVNAVPQVATYIPGNIDYRAPVAVAS
jgi:nitrogen regulatory protein PII